MGLIRFRGLGATEGKVSHGGLKRAEEGGRGVNDGIWENAPEGKE